MFSEKESESSKPLLGYAGGKATKHDSQSSRCIPAFILAGILYALTSGCLTLLNKHALAGFGFTAPNMLLLFQCGLTVVLVKACELLGLIKPLQPLKRDLVAVWWVLLCSFQPSQACSARCLTLAHVQHSKLALTTSSHFCAAGSLLTCSL